VDEYSNNESFVKLFTIRIDVLLFKCSILSAGFHRVKLTPNRISYFQTPLCVLIARSEPGRPRRFTGVVSLRECSLDAEGKKGSINYTKLQTPSVKKATRLAANALSIPIDERGEIYTVVLQAFIDVADYRVAWNATQHVAFHATRSSLSKKFEYSNSIQILRIFK
jgi:hypothetical protein